MSQQFHQLPRTGRLGPIIAAYLLSTAALIFAPPLIAQPSYTCFPTCAVNDGRFLAIAGSELSTLAGNEISIGLATPGTATQIEIGIFDGETGGRWDIGDSPLEFTLYADPLGNGSGTHQVGQWSGTVMPDNAWHTITITNGTQALASNGNYVYYMRVRMPNSLLNSVSAFKLRTSGTIAVKAHQSFNIIAALSSNLDVPVIYPLYPSSLDKSTYDGTWSIYLDVPTSSTSLTVWDGDMDFGSYDASTLDTDDPDTRSDSLPSWAIPSTTFLEGAIRTNVTAKNAAGQTIPGFTSGLPADDHGSPLYRRSPSISYEIIDPNGVRYLNDNPSGDREWEQFRIDTQPFDRTKMDHHADALPAGIYQVRIVGMDMANLNAWRFFNNAVGASTHEVVGVNDLGNPIAPVRAVATVSGSASGVIFYDANINGKQDPGEPGIPSVTVNLVVKNADGSINKTLTTMTDADGKYYFSSIPGGTHVITMNMATLENDVTPTCDADGIQTPNSTNIAISIAQTSQTAMFGYRRLNPPGTGTRGFWVNHPEDWPVQNLILGNTSFTKTALIEILQRATRGDKTYSMAAQLIATKLNLANGNQSSCITSTVVSADNWLIQFPIGSGATKPGCNWTTGEPLHKALDDYNNGRLCAPHMN